MDVQDIPNPEAPDLNQPSGDTGAGFQSDTAIPTPGSPEYLGHMAKRGGATEKEVAMIVGAARKSEPGYIKEENNDGTTVDEDSGDPAGDSADDPADDPGDTGGLSISSLQDEVTTNEGKLSDDTLSKLEDIGFKRADVEKYVAEQYKLASGEAAKITAEVYSEVGGKERYLEMVEWAGDNMPMREVKGINADLASGDMAKVKDAMGRLNKRFTSKNGSPPRKIQRGSKKSTTQSAEVYRSQAELTAAINDPRYKKDPAYRSDVAKRLGRSSF